MDGTVYAASIGGVIASFDLATGHAHWRRSFATPVYGSGAGKRRLGFFGGVAIAADRVVAASDRVAALDSHTGRTIWTAKRLRTSTSDDYFWGPPVVARGLVLVGSGSGAELPTARGRLSAYSLRDGSLDWSTPTVPRGANGGGVIAPASVDLHANLAYVATGSPYRALPGPNPGTGSLLALRLDNGAVVWRDQVYPHDTHGFDFGWIARGKTSGEIAAILLVSPHTVRKHVEHILEKLYVSTRSAAVARAFAAPPSTAADGRPL